MRSAMMVCTGATIKKPIVDQETGEIKVGQVMDVVITGDHRFGDAALFINWFKCARGYVEDPENFDESLYPYNGMPREERARLEERKKAINEKKLAAK